MELEELNLIVDRIVNALNGICIQIDDGARLIREGLRRLEVAVEMVHLECEGT